MSVDTHASQISSEADLLHYINTSNRDACCFSVLSSVLMLSFFFLGTSLTLISGQKYPLPEGVGERCYSM